MKNKRCPECGERLANHAMAMAKWSSLLVVLIAMQETQTRYIFRNDV